MEDIAKLFGRETSDIFSAVATAISDPNFPIFAGEKRRAKRCEKTSKKPESTPEFGTARVRRGKKDIPFSPSSNPSEMIDFDVKDINIFALDRKIQDKLHAHLSTMESLERDLNNMLWMIANAVDPADRISAEHRSEILRRRIQDLEFGMKLGLYLLRSAPLLEEYREILNREHESIETFGSAKKKVHCEADRRKMELRLDFIRIAKEYINLSEFEQSLVRSTKLTCTCGSQDFVVAEECSYTCKVCGCIIEQMEETPLFPDTDRVNMCARYAYSRKTHFTEAIACFQAKESTVVPDAIIEIVEEEMRLHNLTPETLTKNHVSMFLSEQELSNYYMNVPSIYYRITKKTPPDILEYEQRLIDAHEQLEDAYQRVKDPDRVNSMNVYFKLYKLLRREGFFCKPSDFPMLKTKQKRDEHQEIYAKCCQLLGWDNSED